MNKTLAVGIAIIVIFAGIFLYNNRLSGGSNTPDIKTEAVVPADTDQATSASDETSANVKYFTVTGSSFAFAPSTLTVNKGDTVKIHFVNSGGMHDFVIDEFNARTSKLQSGQSEDITFVADKAGTFEYYCSVGTHRQMGMKGTITVK